MPQNRNMKTESKQFELVNIYKREENRLSQISSLENLPDKICLIDHQTHVEDCDFEGIILQFNINEPDDYQFKIFDRILNKELHLELIKDLNKKHHSSNKTKQENFKLKALCFVHKAGTLYPGLHFEYKPRIFTFSILTLSDRAFKGIYDDLSGPAISRLIQTFFEQKQRPVKINNEIIPDDEKLLETFLERTMEKAPDVIITTGGTGIGPRDITPDVVAKYLDKEIRGIMELIRVKYGMQNPNAVVSRSIAGVMKNSLVYVLPGSVKAIHEYMAEILPTIDHSLRMLHGIDQH